MITSDVFSNMDETFGSAVQSGFKRIRSWHVPPTLLQSSLQFNWLPVVPGQPLWTEITVSYADPHVLIEAVPVLRVAVITVLLSVVTKLPKAS